MMAILFLASILSTFALTAVIDRSDTVQAAMESAFCPAESALSLRGGRTRRQTSSPLRTSATGFRAYCVSETGASDFCEACSATAASPFLLFVAVAATSFLGSLRKKPSAIDHLAQLETALGLGALSREQYDALRREVLANPDMTRERFQAALARARCG